MQNLFTYPLKLEDMSQSTQKYRLIATAENLEYISNIMQLPVKRFEAEINVKLHTKEHIIDVWGDIDADVEHTSVVSLENFVRNYQTDFKLKFDTKMTSQEQQELDLDIEADVPDILEDGKIDLAAVAMEQLALVLDDFPRQEGEVFSFASAVTLFGSESACLSWLELSLRPVGWAMTISAGLIWIYAKSVGKSI